MFWTLSHVARRFTRFVGLELPLPVRMVLVKDSSRRTGVGDGILYGVIDASCRHVAVDGVVALRLSDWSVLVLEPYEASEGSFETFRLSILTRSEGMPHVLGESTSLLNARQVAATLAQRTELPFRDETAPDEAGAGL